MPQIQATKISEVTAFLNANGGLAIVDCYATWCGPCKTIAPYAHEQMQKTGIGLIKVDVDQSIELSSVYQIECMPTFLLIQGQWNNVVQKVQGGSPAELTKLFNRALGLKHKL